jgi:hypothetical protein
MSGLAYGKIFSGARAVQRSNVVDYAAGGCTVEQRSGAGGTRRRLVNLKDGINRLFGSGSTRQAAEHGQAAPGARHSQDPARQEQTRRDALAHDGVFSEKFARTLEAADEGRVFPESAKDQIEYLGNVEPLGLTEREKEIVRRWTAELVDERGGKSVWNSRLRLKLELRYLIAEGGLQKMPSGRETGRKG